MLLTEGSYRIIGTAGNGDYILRRVEARAFSDPELTGPPMTIAGSRKVQFQVGLNVEFDPSLGMFTQFTGSGINSQAKTFRDKRFSIYYKTIQESAIDPNTTNTVVYYDPYDGIRCEFVIVGKTKDKVDELAGMVKYRRVADFVDYDVSYGGSNRLYGSIYGINGMLRSRVLREIVETQKDSKLIGLEDLALRLEEDLMQRKKTHIEFLVESTPLAK